ncbi:MAG: hypothetical protein IK017_08000 [Paludibacteraceae bacterium]|nr:hypothetical protein [Paludibacteraceae bacterium]
MVIAVDFDGTIVTNEYPNIGTEIPFAIDVLKRIQKEGNHRLILWTAREGKEQEEAVEWCRLHGLEFYAVNKNHPEETETFPNYSKKVKATYYIDDHNFPGGTPDWNKIYQQIILNESEQAEQNHLFLIEAESNIFVRFGRWIEKIKRKVERY